ncbi:hypothetical protein SAMN05421770_107272 [Granulicella rosea]|uniref:Uncharacterized protein n=1 Tax=Granulicella rosea TaxID=474952 RepID=A0A239LSX7_9BACT|nr:hypothetical protein [Granulicella rosea]SNT33636.1 hypothetical protein SAMN05421770_107272 [Granulicella rosea]
MGDGVQSGLIQATQVASETALRRAANGVSYASYGETEIAGNDLDRMVQAVPATIAGALGDKAYYFVPLALAEGRESRPGSHKNGEDTMIAQAYTAELGDEAICHRNVTLGGPEGGKTEGVFISTRLLNDKFALAFEFFINVGHAFVETAGVPEEFTALAWGQVVADVRGETSQDAWESRNLARAGHAEGKAQVDEKAKNSFLEAAFSDALAIYQLSLSVDFDYSELREREYPLIAPAALADRLRLMAKLFPPNAGYEFAIRYRRRA